MLKTQDSTSRLQKKFVCFFLNQCQRSYLLSASAPFPFASASLPLSFSAAPTVQPVSSSLPHAVWPVPLPTASVAAPLQAFSCTHQTHKL